MIVIPPVGSFAAQADLLNVLLREIAIAILEEAEDRGLVRLTRALDRLVARSFVGRLFG